MLLLLRLKLQITTTDIERVFVLWCVPHWVTAQISLTVTTCTALKERQIKTVTIFSRFPSMLRRHPEGGCDVSVSRLLHLRLRFMLIRGRCSKCKFFIKSKRVSMCATGVIVANNA